MIPGIWLEIEVMGTKCKLAKELPDECFFMRHGKRVIDHGRYHLDIRNKKVVEYLDGVIDRIVEDFDIDYINNYCHQHPNNKITIVGHSMGGYAASNIINVLDINVVNKIIAILRK